MAGIIEEEAAAGNINPLLLPSARKGFWEALEFLFDREDRQEAPMMIPTDEFRVVLATAYRRIGVAAPPNAELGLGVGYLQPASLAAGAILKGVTPAGDTALHVVASNGDDQDFLKSAGRICRRDRTLLFVKNHNGDTPLHCARRAGNLKMASYLIDLAGPEAAPRDINPLLLLSARVGSSEALGFLLRQNPQLLVPTDGFYRCLRGIGVPNSDVEAGVDHQPELLKGVTPYGDTVLHAVARNGDGRDFRKYARMICSRDRDLLFAKNHNGDTPLHSAVRAGNSKMVSRLIDLAGREGANWKLTLLRMQNKRHETALHEAIRIEDGRILGPKDRKALFHAGRISAEKIRDFVGQQQGMPIVKRLMAADPQLGNYPADGISPLYLAILLQKSTIALTLYHVSRRNILSYLGANGQNALHVAVLRNTDTVIIELLLDWNRSLTAQVDKDGSTPLHFARFGWRPIWTLEIVFEANPAALYQADKKGFFPIHVAASLGARYAILFFLRECPDSAVLSDARGKTFLHVAAEKGRLGIVSDVCGNPSLDWIVNMQDNDGNTALHLAIQTASFRVFCALFGHPEVNLNLTNNQGETPRDLSRSMIPRGVSYVGNSTRLIYSALLSIGANFGTLRWDKNEEKCSPHAKPEDEDKESERLKDASQKFIVASVLIATMAFSATFAIPGGYRADEHKNAGTPTLAGGYVFHAFVMATALAFICSSVATVGFMFAGVPMVSLAIRQINFRRSVFFISNSVTSMFAAFALGVYMLLAPVARDTAIAVCVITPAVLVVRDVPFFRKLGILLQPLLIRKGLFLGTVQLLTWVMRTMLIALWPFLVTFGWAAVATIQWRHVQVHQVWMVLGWSSVVIGYSIIVIFVGATLAWIQHRRLYFRVIQWYRSI